MLNTLKKIWAARDYLWHIIVSFVFMAFGGLSYFGFDMVVLGLVVTAVGFVLFVYDTIMFFYGDPIAKEIAAFDAHVDEVLGWNLPSANTDNITQK
jgi:hypothetical protein